MSIRDRTDSFVTGTMTQSINAKLSLPRTSEYSNMGSKEEFSDTLIRNIGRDDVRNYLQQLLNDYAYSTVEKIKQVLGYFFNYAIWKKYITNDPTNGILSELRVDSNDTPEETTEVKALTKT